MSEEIFCPRCGQFIHDTDNGDAESTEKAECESCGHIGYDVECYTTTPPDFIWLCEDCAGGESSTSAKSPVEKDAQALSSTSEVGAIEEDKEQARGVEPPKPDAFKVRYRDFSYPEALMPADFEEENLTGQEKVEALFGAETIHEEIEKTKQRLDEMDEYVSVSPTAVLNELEEVFEK